MWLRTATKNDIESIRELLFETWHATYDDLIGKDIVDKIIAKWHSADSLKKYLTRPSSEYIVADDGDEVQGVAYAMQGGVKGAPETVLIQQLYVRPKYQGQGIGKRLLIEVEESYPNARKCRVMVLELNTATQKFYESQGYRKIGAPLPVTEQHDLFEIIMEKELF